MLEEMTENNEKSNKSKTGYDFDTPSLKKIPILPDTPIAPKKAKILLEKNAVKSTIRRRSLTMSDIRNRTTHQSTSSKLLKKDSCSTTNTSPNNKLNTEKQIISIHRRELKVSVLSRFFYHLWRKQKTVADGYKSELKQLNLQKLFLMNLRDKESERREEITKVADQQKKEIIELTDILSLITQEHEAVQNFCKILEQEYINCIKHIEDNNNNYATIEEQNQQILSKITETSKMMDTELDDLKQSSCWVREVKNKFQQKLINFNILKRENEVYSKKSELHNTTINMLQEKLRIKEENEKNLKTSIRELQNNLDNSQSNNLNLKSEVKNIQLQLEYAEHLIEEQKFHSHPWSDFIWKATTISMYLLFQLVAVF